jgi:hypothetical protein
MKNTKWIAGGFFLVVCGVFLVFVVRDEGPRLRLADAEDLLELRKAKKAERLKRSIPLSRVKRELRIK